jgi:hypothetical protein
VQHLRGGLELSCAEYRLCRLHLQFGLVGASWRAMFPVRRRQIQERGWIWSLRQLPGGLELACAEYGFGQLHV